MTNDDYLSLQNFIYAYEERWTFLVAQMVKNLPAMQDTWTQSPSQEDFSGEGNSYPLQYSCLEKSMDKGAWQATVHGVTKNWTQVSNKL